MCGNNAFWLERANHVRQQCLLTWARQSCAATMSTDLSAPIMCGNDDYWLVRANHVRQQCLLIWARQSCAATMPTDLNAPIMWGNDVCWLERANHVRKQCLLTFTEVCWLGRSREPRTWSLKLNCLDILTASHHYFWQKRRMCNLILGLKGLTVTRWIPNERCPPLGISRNWRTVCLFFVFNSFSKSRPALLIFRGKDILSNKVHTSEWDRDHHNILFQDDLPWSQGQVVLK